MVSSNSIILGCEIVILLCIIYIYSNIKHYIRYMKAMCDSYGSSDSDGFCNVLKCAGLITVASIVLLGNDAYSRYKIYKESKVVV